MVALMTLPVALAAAPTMLSQADVQRGAIDLVAVRATLDQHQAQVESCVAQNGASGRVELHLTLAADGAVTRATTTLDALTDRSTSDCLRDATTSWSWPHPTSAPAELTLTWTSAALVRALLGSAGEGLNPEQLQARLAAAPAAAPPTARSRPTYIADLAGPVALEGSPDLTRVAAALRPTPAQVASCTEQIPGLPEVFDLTLTLRVHDGRVTAQVSEPLNDPMKALADCVQVRSRSWRVPTDAGPDDYVVALPVHLYTKTIPVSPDSPGP